MQVNTNYIAPLMDMVELLAEGSFLAQSGMDIGIGGWDDSGDDFGGSAE